MTDIAHHLKPILKRIRAHLAEGNVSTEALHTALTELLPPSYGVASGQVVAGEHSSDTIPILLYDQPLAGGAYTAASHTFQHSHILLTLEVIQDATLTDLQDALTRTASVKRLGTRDEPPTKHGKTTPVGQRRERVPKHRLPLGVIVINHLVGLPDTENSFFEAILAELDRYPLEHQPDYLFLESASARLYNPWLDGKVPAPYAIGLQRLPKLKTTRICYVCKEKFLDRHFFYDQLCSTCGDMNYRKRQASADLRGRIALVTGGRVKIGYATALRLLKQGAQVIVTSRFPHDTARRYAQEPDFAAWADRLDIYGLDLRFTPNVDAFIHFLYQTYPHLDILVNNAAQTLQRPPAFYAHLLPFEQTPRPALPEPIQRLLMPKNGVTTPHGLIPVAPPLPEITMVDTNSAEFPVGQLDAHGQQVDLRAFNSWVMSIDQVPMTEMVEVHLVNAIAPALLVGQLKELLQKSPHPQRFIINVSAMEGVFSGSKERGNHPHTNMSKAALNMLTYTVSANYEDVGILVYGVDPGWISDQFPSTVVDQRANIINLPLYMEDAAARICDPLVMALQGQAFRVGQLLKDYRPIAW